MLEMLRKRYPQLPGEPDEEYQERISYEMEEIRAYANQVARTTAYDSFRATDGEIPDIVDIPYDVLVEVLERYQNDVMNEGVIQLVDKASQRYRDYLGSTQWQEKRELALRQGKSAKTVDAGPGSKSIIGTTIVFLEN